MDIISIAQHARPKLIGQMEFLRAQLIAQSTEVVMMLSLNGFSSSWSIRANSSAGWLI